MYVLMPRSVTEKSVSDVRSERHSELGSLRSSIPTSRQPVGVPDASEVVR